MEGYQPGSASRMEFIGSNSKYSVDVLMSKLNALFDEQDRLKKESNKVDAQIRLMQELIIYKMREAED